MRGGGGRGVGEGGQVRCETQCSRLPVPDTWEDRNAQRLVCPVAWRFRWTRVGIELLDSIVEPQEHRTM
jgi:hypothetical protein